MAYVENFLEKKELMKIHEEKGKSFFLVEEIYENKGGIVILETGGVLKDMKSGFIIACKKCQKQEIVSKGSLCDIWRLCIEHTRKEIHKRWKNRSRQTN